ncbi:glutathione peroxidase [Rhodocytophaga rosea]|uniref:Glutathione peroxidase n=1 Tax=Rhodocytophaga rosea TaxID=2704465 RepID=A0A6C0GMD4_9BACT|nr:glutathione peroxidase [Rhodocytophaga rosea]
MKLFSFSFLMLIAGIGLLYKTSTTDAVNMGEKPKQSFYDFKLNSIEGKPIDFKKYKGKKVLLVNVASKCGFTPQYGELEELHEKYGDKLVILGFPANNFKEQEPGSNEEIAEFCQKNYGVKFQMFEKISVVGEDQHPLYQWLSKKELNGWNDQAPKWNFSKYLINEKGELVKFFESKVKPTSEEVLSAINS